MGSIKPERGCEGDRTKMITHTEKHLQSHWVRGQGNHVTNFKITVSMRDVWEPLVELQELVIPQSPIGLLWRCPIIWKRVTQTRREWLLWMLNEQSISGRRNSRDRPINPEGQGQHRQRRRNWSEREMAKAKNLFKSLHKKPWMLISKVITPEMDFWSTS